MKPYIINICGPLFLNFAFSISVQAQPYLKAIPYGNNKEDGNFIAVNGVKIYYEIYGEGAPLVLIHGNGGNIANLCIFARENHYVTKNNPDLFNTTAAKYFDEPFQGEELRK